MENIKTLANCTDVEFLRQTNKIRHAVEEWLTATDIANIRKRVAKLQEIPEGIDSKKAEAIEEKNKKLEAEQLHKNINDMLDAMLEEYPEQTLKIIRLCCFVEPDDDSRRVTYYLGAFSQMMGDQDVLDFFSSLLNMAKMFGLTL